MATRSRHGLLGCPLQHERVRADAPLVAWLPPFSARGAGVPDWAADVYASGAQAFPWPIEATGYPLGPDGDPSAADCAKHGWMEYYFSDALGKASQALYDGAYGSAADFHFFWSAIARAWGSASTSNATAAQPQRLLGYELINEPWAGDVIGNPLLLVPGVADKQNLQPFYVNATAAVRAAEVQVGAPARIVSVESVTWDDFIPVGFDYLSGSESGLAVLNYHYYSLPNFNAQWQIASRVKDAARLRAGALLSEFDIGVDVPDYTAVLDVADAYMQSWCGWEYKLFDPITGADSGYWTADGTVNATRARGLARTYPSAVAGTVTGYNFTAATGAFSLSYVLNASIFQGTTVFLSTGLVYTGGYNVQVTSVPPNAVTWSVAEVDGARAPMEADAADVAPVYLNSTAAAPRTSGRGFVEPPPFAYATLTVLPMDTTFTGAAITVVITAA